MIPDRCVRLLSSLALLGGPAFGSHEPFFQPIPQLPGGSITIARGVSGDGSAVVGEGDSWRSELFEFEAFRWTADDGTIGLGDLRHRYRVVSHAYGASFDGSVVVGWAYSDRGMEAFRWTEDGGMVGLGQLPGGRVGSTAYAASADGSVIVGFGRPAWPAYEAFRWTESEGMVGLGALPGGAYNSVAHAVSADGRVVAGASGSQKGIQAFRWTEGEGMIGLGDPPAGQLSSRAWAVSADGSTIVGYATRADNRVGAFRWTEESGMADLGVLEGRSINSEAYGVSGDGSIVVGITWGLDRSYGFIWDEVHGMRALEEVLTQESELDLRGWQLNEVTGISADGLTFVGNSAGGAWVAHIPEPSALALMLVGAGVAVRRRTA